MNLKEVIEKVRRWAEEERSSGGYPIEIDVNDAFLLLRAAVAGANDGFDGDSDEDWYFSAKELEGWL